jgi:ribonuclease P/MRP protein subunit RPP40
MAFNVAKCKVMHVGRNNPEYDYTMRGVKLGKTDEEKDIGVTITKNLKPSVQCEKAEGRAMAILNQIRRNFHYRDRHTFVRLYKQYVRPHLEFASSSCSPWLAGDIEKIEKVQEKAVNMVAGLKSKFQREQRKVQ